MKNFHRYQFLRKIIQNIFNNSIGKLIFYTFSDFHVVLGWLDACLLSGLNLERFWYSLDHLRRQNPRTHRCRHHSSRCSISATHNFPLPSLLDSYLSVDWHSNDFMLLFLVQFNFSLIFCIYIVLGMTINIDF